MAVNDWLLLVQAPGRTLENAETTRRRLYGPRGESVTLVLNEIGTTTLTTTATTAPIVELQWSVTPEEGCLDGIIEGGSLGADFSIGSMDIVTIFTKGYRSLETTTWYYPRYRGTAITAPSTHREDGKPTRISLEGSRESLYFVPTGKNQPRTGRYQDIVLFTLADVLVSDDLGTNRMGNGVAAGPWPNTGLGSTDTPINANGKNVGEFLDAIVNVAGNAVWGVNPYGNPYLRTPSEESDFLVEGSEGAEAVWHDVQGHRSASRVKWFLGQGNSGQKAFATGGVDLTTPDNLTYLSIVNAGDPMQRTLEEAPGSESTPLKAIEVSLGFQGSAEASYVGRHKDSTLTFSRIYDEDPTSYLVLRPSILTDSGYSTYYAQISLTEIEDIGPEDVVAISYSINSALEGKTPECAVALQLVYDRDFINRQTTFNLHGQAHYNGNNFYSDGVVYAQGLGALQGEIIFGDRARTDRPPSFVSAFMRFLAPTNDVYIAINDFRMWKIDKDALDKAASTLVSVPERDASLVSVEGERLPFSAVSFRNLSGVTVSGMPVTSIDYLISGPRGQRTAYNIGPRADSGAYAVTSAIQDKDRRGVIRAHNLTFSGRSRG